MSDERLRELRRRWEQTGEAADAASLLQEQVRTGQLTRAQLELLAYAEDPGAQALVPGDPIPTSATEWMKGLLRFKALGSRAACVAAMCATHARRGVDTERSLAARRAVMAWINCPCKEHEVAAAKLRDGGHEIADLRSGDVYALHGVGCAARRARRDCVDQACLVLGAWGADPTTLLPVILDQIRRWIREGTLRFDG